MIFYLEKKVLSSTVKKATNGLFLNYGDFNEKDMLEIYFSSLLFVGLN